MQAPKYDRADPANQPLLRAMRTWPRLSVAGQAAGLALAGFVGEERLPWAVLVGGLGLQAGLGQAMLWRLRRHGGVDEAGLLGQGLAELLILSWMGHAITAGPQPLAGMLMVPFLLVPTAIAAALLSGPRRWVSATAAAGLCGWLILAALRRVVPPLGPAELQLPLSALWLTVLLAAGLLAAFVGLWAQQAREHERRLAEAARRERDSSFLVEVGSLAAGTAHELASPLNTIAVVADELSSRRDASPPELRQGLHTIARQVDACKATLAGLRDCGRLAAADAEGVHERADAFVDGVVGRWLAARPGVRLRRRCSRRTPPRVPADRRLAQGLANLLNNAADASRAEVVLDCIWRADHVVLGIRDRGPGIAPALAEGRAAPSFTTKREGLGLGLLLARTAVERAGGRLRLSARKGGGTCALVLLPAVAAAGAGPCERPSSSTPLNGASHGKQ